MWCESSLAVIWDRGWFLGFTVHEDLSDDGEMDMIMSRAIAAAQEAVGV
jgi:hypothetical protein